MIILTMGSSWYLRMWSMKVVPGYLSPPIAIPSYTPFVFREMILLSSFDIPPDLETYATLQKKTNKSIMQEDQYPWFPRI